MCTYKLLKQYRVRDFRSKKLAKNSKNPKSYMTLSCVDTSQLQPLWILFIGVVIQQIVSWAVITLRTAEIKKINPTILAMKASDSMLDPIIQPTPKRQYVWFKRALKYFLITYQLVSVVTIFIMDIQTIYTKTQSLTSSSDRYNCYSSVLIYSSNFKTICINLLYMGFVFMVGLQHALGTMMQDETNWKHNVMNKYDGWNMLMLIVMVILSIPYIPIIFSHLLPGMITYIWFTLSCIGSCVILFGLICCVDTRTNILQKFNIKKKSIDIWPLLMFVFTILTYFWILMTCSMFAHKWYSTKYGAWKSVFTERNTNDYFNHLIYETEAMYQSIENFWRFITYLL